MARDPKPDPSPTRLPKDVVVAAVVSQYHRELTEAMLYSAWREFVAAGLEDDGEHWIVVQAPGAFELPVLANEVAQGMTVSAVMCLGVVIKGETSHDFHIAASVSHELQRIAVHHQIPMLFGLLTCDTLEQARERALPGGHDKGREVARATIECLRSMECVADEGDPGYWAAARAREEARLRS